MNKIDRLKRGRIRQKQSHSSGRYLITHITFELKQTIRCPQQ